MNRIYLHCQKCGCWSGNLEEVKRGLCSLCHEKAIKVIRQKFPESTRSSLADDFVASINLRE